MRVHRDVYGQGDPPLVLVHGYTGASLDWRDVVGPLSQSRRVVTYDHRGHGRSPHAGPGGYSIDALVRDFEALVEELDLAPMHLLGHSMGGIVAQRYTLSHPQNVVSLVLMDTSSEPMRSPELDQWREPMTAAAREHGMGYLAQRISELTGGDEAALALANEKIGRMDVEAFADLGAELGTYESMRPRLGEYRCPVTVIVGENDRGLRAAADVFAAEIPGAVLEVIPDAGHSPQEDQPAAWLAAVNRHLSR